MTQNSIGTSIPIEVSKGGTNATTMSTSTGIVKYDGTSLVTSTTALIDSSNRQTNSGQPAFFAYPASTQANAVGKNAVYTLGSGVALTIVFDQNTNLNTNGTFTAPIAGNYFFYSTTIVRDCTAATSMQRNLVTTSRTLSRNRYRAASSADFSLDISGIFYMAAGDTCTSQVAVGGETGNNDSVYGSGSPNWTTFGGYLVC